MSDEELARQVAHGSREAFAALYDRHHQALYRYGRSILRDPDQAQDALQSAMASAFAALSAGERDLAVRPWLFRIVHNEAISLLRRRRSLDVEVQESVLAASEDRAPQRTLEQRERLSSLLVDLQALSERQRSALLMRELSGLAIEEIAAALSITPATAKQTLFEARSALREMAEGRACDCESIRRLIDERDRRVLRARGVRSHLRSCAACREYEQAIATRSADLRALAPPLPAAAASTVLTRLLVGSASPHAASVAAATSGSGIAGSAAGGSGAAASGAGVGAGSAAGVAGSGVGAATSVKAIAAVVLIVAGGAGAAHLALSGSGGRRAPAPHGAARPVSRTALRAGRQSQHTDPASALPPSRSGKAHAAAVIHGRHAHLVLASRKAIVAPAKLQASHAPGAREPGVHQEEHRGRSQGSGEGHGRDTGSQKASARSHGGAGRQRGASHERSTNGHREGRGHAPGRAEPESTPHGAAGKVPPGHAKGNPQDEGAGESSGGAESASSQQAPEHPRHSGKQAH